MEREISVQVIAGPLDLTLLAKAFTDQYLKQQGADGKSVTNDVKQKSA